jgi:hypothetical protein
VRPLYLCSRTFYPLDYQVPVLVPYLAAPALLQCYLTTTSPFMPSCSWPSTGQYIS